VGACIVLLTWSREERSERFGDPRDVRMLVPFVRWNDGLLPLEKRLRWRKFAQIRERKSPRRDDVHATYINDICDEIYTRTAFCSAFFFLKSDVLVVKGHRHPEHRSNHHVFPHVCLKSHQI